MFPSFTIFGREIPMYLILVAIGAVAFYIVFYLRCRDPRFRRDQILHIVLCAAGGAVLGAHIFYFFTRLDILGTVLKDPGRYIKSFGDFLNVISVLFGGMVFYGGLFGAMIGGYLYCRALKLDFDMYLDAAAPGIPLFHVFGRIGCVFAGCCYGFECSYGLSFRYSATADPAKLYFPIQLVESGINLILFLILLLISKKKLPKGVLFWIYGVMYSVVRFADEFFRGDEIRGKILFLSTSQFISVLFLAVSVIMIVLKAKKETVSDENGAAT